MSELYGYLETGFVTKDGHTMFIEDVVKDLNALYRKANNRPNQWVPVEDRLPENDDLVLIHPPVELMNWHHIGYYDPHKEKCFIVVEDEIYDTNYHKHTGVTHWQPLPQPPEGE